MLKINELYMYYPQPKRYKDFILRPFENRRTEALSNINMEVQPGDKVAFLGSNGAGKTTLLKLVGGLLYPSRGSITVNGYDTIKNNLAARKSVGFVLNEERSFYWRLTGLQNLEFFGVLDNLYGQALKEKTRELIGLVGLNDAANKLVAGYSSGMKQKLAIARGLLSDPDILILDEPTRTLDPIATEEIKDLIQKKVNQDKERVLLMATHSLEEAETLCNKACIMNKGRMLEFMTVGEIKARHGDLLRFYKETISVSNDESNS